MEEKKKNRRPEPSFIQKVIIIGVAVLIVYLIMNIGKIGGLFSWIGRVFMPIFVGIVIAFILNPLANIYDNGLEKLLAKKWPAKASAIAKPISVILALLTVILFIGLIILVAIPEITDAALILKNSLPPMIQSLLDWIYKVLTGFGVEMEPLTLDTLNWSKAIQSFMDMFTNGSINDIFGNISGAVSSIAGFLFNTVIGIIIAINILAKKKKIFAFMDKWMKLYIKPTINNGIHDILGLVSDAFRNFVTGQLTEAMILFVLCLIGMSIFRFPYVVATSAIIAITALIPMFGAWIGGAIGALLALTVSPMKMLLFVVFVVVLQLIDNYIVYPRVIGNQMSLPSLLVMVAVIIGGNMQGLIGMIFSVPIMSIIYTLVLRMINQKEKNLLSARHITPPAPPPNETAAEPPAADNNRAE